MFDGGYVSLLSLSFIFIMLQLSMKLGLKMGLSFRNLMGWNSQLKMVISVLLWPRL